MLWAQEFLSARISNQHAKCKNNIRVTAFFQNNLGKLAPGRQTTLDF